MSNPNEIQSPSQPGDRQGAREVPVYPDLEVRRETKRLHLLVSMLVDEISRRQRYTDRDLMAIASYLNGETCASLGRRMPRLDGKGVGVTRERARSIQAGLR